MQKTTLIIGASNNPTRYSYKAAHDLLENGHKIIPFGVKKGEVFGHKIENEWNPNWKVDTVTMYINPKIQKEFYDRILALKPRRVIFNPGTENTEFEEILKQNNIDFEKACTLVLLSIGAY